jgi:hypothetical protein
MADAARIHRLNVSALQPADVAAWQAFVARSPNATLFHDLEFLAYHRDTLAFHHLLVRSDGNLVAIVPGGLVESDGKKTWRSPLGASIGGPVLAGTPRLDSVIAIVEALLDHARAQGWTSIEITLPPSVYHPAVGDIVTFAVVRHGFREQGRWLSPMIDLDRAPNDAPPSATLFEKRQLQTLQAATNAGIAACNGGLAELSQFAPVFEETYARLGTRPTHTIDDLAFLLRRFPDRIHIELASDASGTMAGVFVMRLTNRVAVTTYICSTDDGRRAGAVVVAIDSLLSRLRADGVRWLDLGPSATERSTNAGVLLFKEGLGGVGYCRTRWSQQL